MEQLTPTVRLDGSAVKKIREDKGLTQLYVATVIGVTTDTISRWENKRYPSIKRENAIKLAEALGVELEELLEIQEEEKEERENIPQEISKDSPSKAHPWKFFLSVCLAFVLGVISSIYYFKMFGHSAQLNISAKRFLPERCSVNTPFPVILQLGIHPPVRTAILVTEDIPKSIRILKTIPRASTSAQGLLKWLLQGMIKSRKFAYIALIPPTIKNKKYLRFKGKVTIKSDRSISVDTSGNEKIRISQVHWADKDGNFIIDDEEILDVYDLMSGLEDVKGLLKEIETLWAAGGYHWSKRKKAFVPGFQMEKGDKKHETSRKK